MTQIVASAAPLILVVEGRFYGDIADELVAGALDVLEAEGARWVRQPVPGAFEIPGAIALAHAADPRRFAGYVALGCVIRGETSHYDHVCAETCRGLMTLTVRHGVALGNGVLTVESEAQAWARARRFEKNKGSVAARACLAMIAVHRTLSWA